MPGERSAIRIASASARSFLTDWRLRKADELGGHQPRRQPQALRRAAPVMGAAADLMPITRARRRRAEPTESPPD